ncbi:MAG: esterase-like activity of phytase family protein [Pseudomonadota bacterium]
MRHTFAAALCSVLAGLPGAAFAACEEPAALAVTAEPVTLAPDTLEGVRMVGAWVLTAPDPTFGGFSGLVVTNRAGAEPAPGAERGFVAIGDRGQEIAGFYRPGAPGCVLHVVVNRPLTDDAGRALSGEAADAEALALGGEGVLIAFERQHRIEYRDTAGAVLTRADRAFQRLSHNGGLEALATVPPGTEPGAGESGAGAAPGDLIAIAEDPDAEGFPVFLLKGGVASRAAPIESRLALPGPHRVTGADIGADGTLYLVRRHFDRAIGVSILVEAMPLAALFAPDAAAATRVLARFGPESGIDNMEAIAVSRDGAETRLTILSDDNFNPGQRTLLVELSLTE